MFILKEKAEQTDNPELFELYYKTAEVYASLIRSINELAKAYSEQVKQASKFDLAMWVKYQRLQRYAAHLQQELDNEQKDLINFVTMTVNYSQKH